MCMEHYHYTYIVENTQKDAKPKFYIGVRTCTCPPDDDSYYGSSTYLNEDIDRLGISQFNKTILKVFSTREEAMQHEIQLHEQHDVMNSSLYYNKTNARSDKFTFIGEHSEQTKSKIREKRKNQTFSEETKQKRKNTWVNKTIQEKEEYSQYRKQLWKMKDEEEKQLHKDKMSDIVTEYWTHLPESNKHSRTNKILETKSKWSAEQKQEISRKQSIAQKINKRNRTADEINATVEKRKKTYNDMSEERKNEIKQKHSRKMKGRKWYNNGNISRMFFPSDVPPGFTQGRIKNA